VHLFVSSGTLASRCARRQSAARRALCSGDAPGAAFRDKVSVTRRWQVCGGGGGEAAGCIIHISSL
jgi:hypothetical protein